jgi:hypothetical protein
MLQLQEVEDRKTPAATTRGGGSGMANPGVHRGEVDGTGKRQIDSHSLFLPLQPYVVLEKVRRRKSYVYRDLANVRFIFV